jgi:rsbT co-antagonist protein RsbR
MIALKGIESLRRLNTGTEGRGGPVTLITSDRESESHLRLPEDREALESYWAVYDHSYEAITADLMAGIEAHPEFGPLLRSMTPEQIEQQGRESHERMRSAVLYGDWDQYLENLRVEGASYARAGISFSSWFGLLADLRVPLWHRLFEAHGDNQELLQRVLVSAEQVTDVAMAAMGEAYLREKQRVIVEQSEAIHELSSPVLLLSTGLLLLPLIGMVDSDRARQVTENLLEAISAHRAKVVVIDVTGVPAVDSAVANHLIQTAEAARLMGATAIVTGMSTINAQTLVRIGVNPASLNTRGDLSSGLEEAHRILDGDAPTDGDALGVPLRR